MQKPNSNSKKLAGKVAIVTGASKGIGAAIAKSLAAQGASVVVNYSSSKADGEKVVREIKKQGGKAIALQANMSKRADIDRLFAKSKKALGRLDILVNNAGILRLGGLNDMPLTDIDALLNVNVRSPIVASKAALRHLGKGGRIITIGSYFADRVPAPVLGLYSASKSALSAFTKGLARELGPKDITVNLVQPGSINTDMNPAHGPIAETLKQFMALGRYGTPDDIANAVAFLASEKAKYVTGSTLTVDGGANA